MSSFEEARRLIDLAHDGDPVKTSDGIAAERVYADRMEAWAVRLKPDASPVERLAARCQHLERWVVPRSQFPEGRTGYLNWRRHLYVKQATRAREILVTAGIDPAEADQAFTWISKNGLHTNPGTQLLEDSACLVFLENEIQDFAATHAGYPKEKFIEIIRKTWKKMSPAAHAAAQKLPLPPGIAELVAEALA